MIPGKGASISRSILHQLSQVADSPLLIKARHYFERNPEAGVAVEQFGLLLALVLLDLVLRMPPGAQMLLAIPIFRATQKGGMGSGVAIAVPALIAGTVIDGVAGITSGGWLVSFFTRAFADFTLVFMVDSVRDRLNQTTKLSRMDSLTQVLNRLGFMQAAERELENCFRQGLEAVVVGLDLDKFKALNDLYGHAFGDQILRTFVDCVKPAVSGCGIFGRAGGDEFLLMFMDADKTKVEESLIRATRRFSDSTLVLGHASSFSFGMASTRGDAVTLVSLLEKADVDMYRRKATKQFAQVI